MEGTAIAVQGVSKTFGGRQAVAEATLDIGRGETVALLGPSGSGKTTLLRVIAGFERPDAGMVAIGGRVVCGPGTWVEPERRRIGMVFQQGALFPHLTVAANVGFGATSPDRAAECLALVGLAARSKAFPHELSGGERQRVALARALAADPEVVMLDEPFAALDAGLRESLREEVSAILRAAGASTLLVTHDQSEALSLADRVAVLRDGRVEQVGTPAELFARPCSRWIAQFIGDANVLPARRDGDELECELGRWPLNGAPREGDLEMIVRPEAVSVHTAAGDRDAEHGIASGVVVSSAFFGHHEVVRVQLPSGIVLRSRSLLPGGWHPGQEVHVHVNGPVTAVPAVNETEPV